MNCWKCGDLTSSQDQLCTKCTPITISSTKKILKKAKQRADRIDASLNAFKERIKTWKFQQEKSLQEESSPTENGTKSTEDQDISRCIHYLCLMADELEIKIAQKPVIGSGELQELKEKALNIVALVNKLLSN